MDGGGDSGDRSQQWRASATSQPSSTAYTSDSRSIVAVVDGVVHRRAGPWSHAVQDLLAYLHSVGFAFAPRPLGFDEQGNELLGFIDGACGADAWAHIASDDGVVAFGRLLRAYHDAVADYRPVTDAWATVPKVVEDGEIICHGDFGPWNVVWRDGEPVGIIDWDFAAPRPARFDVAYALEYVAPFRDDDRWRKWTGRAAPPDRRKRVRIFMEAYGIDFVDGVVDEVAEVQRDTMRAVQHLASMGRQPQLEWVASGHLDDMARRVAWTEQHRHLFE